MSESTCDSTISPPTSPVAMRATGMLAQPLSAAIRSIVMQTQIPWTRLMKLLVQAELLLRRYVARHWPRPQARVRSEPDGRLRRRLLVRIAIHHQIGGTHLLDGDGIHQRLERAT